MAFCKYCGSKLDNDSVFCSKCGNPVDAADNKKQKQQSEDSGEPKLGKCPNCGGLVKSFSTNCEFCGYEFRSQKSSLKISEFEEEYHNARALSKRIALVQSLPISNSKESLLEVFYLAAANVGNFEKSEKKIEPIWQSKFEQAYLKAGIVLRDDPELQRVEKIYRDKTKELSRKKRQSFWSEQGSMIVLLIVIVFIFFLLTIIAIVAG